LRDDYEREIEEGVLDEAAFAERLLEEFPEFEGDIKRLIDTFKAQLGGLGYALSNLGYPGTDGSFRPNIAAHTSILQLFDKIESNLKDQGREVEKITSRRDEYAEQLAALIELQGIINGLEQDLSGETANQIGAIEQQENSSIVTNRTLAGIGKIQTLEAKSLAEFIQKAENNIKSLETINALNEEAAALREKFERGGRRPLPRFEQERLDKIRFEFADFFEFDIDTGAVKNTFNEIQPLIEEKVGEITKRVSDLRFEIPIAVTLQESLVDATFLTSGFSDEIIGASTAADILSQNLQALEKAYIDTASATEGSGVLLEIIRNEYLETEEAIRDLDKALIASSVRKELEDTFSAISEKSKIFGKNLDVVEAETDAVRNAITELLESGLKVSDAEVQKLIDDYSRYARNLDDVTSSTEELTKAEKELQEQRELQQGLQSFSSLTTNLANAWTRGIEQGFDNVDILGISADLAKAIGSLAGETGEVIGGTIAAGITIIDSLFDIIFARQRLARREAEETSEQIISAFREAGGEAGAEQFVSEIKRVIEDARFEEFLESTFSVGALGFGRTTVRDRIEDLTKAFQEGVISAAEFERKVRFALSGFEALADDLEPVVNEIAETFSTGLEAALARAVEEGDFSIIEESIYNNLRDAVLSSVLQAIGFAEKQKALTEQIAEALAPEGPGGVQITQEEAAAIISNYTEVGREAFNAFNAAFGEIESLLPGVGREEARVQVAGSVISNLSGQARSELQALFEQLGRSFSETITGALEERALIATLNTNTLAVQTMVVESIIFNSPTINIEAADFESAVNQVLNRVNQAA
jgi:hypothetical protein